MSTPQPKTSSPIRYVVLGLLILTAGIVITAAAIYYGPRAFSAHEKASEKQTVAKSRLAVELVEDIPHTLIVPERVRDTLGIQGECGRRKAEAGIGRWSCRGPRHLTRRGSCASALVSTPKSSQIAQVVDGERRTASGETAFRELRPGDRVKKGDVLAVVWSTDVGGRKSDLVDALVQLRLDEKRLKAREELFAKGSLPEDTLNQTRHDVVSDRNAKERAERTLRTWNIPEREIQAVYDEAELASARQGKRDKDKERLWARSELIAPRDGTIVERNVSVGEYVADNTINLFTIADVDRLLVIANPPEDQLPALLALAPGANALEPADGRLASRLRDRSKKSATSSTPTSTRPWSRATSTTRMASCGRVNSCRPPSICRRRPTSSKYR